MADCARRTGVRNLFGRGHSMLTALETYPRDGSSGSTCSARSGCAGMLFLQNTEGCADGMLDVQRLHEGDVLVVFIVTDESARLRVRDGPRGGGTRSSADLT